MCSCHISYAILHLDITKPMLFLNFEIEILLKLTAIVSVIKYLILRSLGDIYYCQYTAISEKVALVNSGYWNRKELWSLGTVITSDNAPIKVVIVWPWH